MTFSLERFTLTNSSVGVHVSKFFLPPANEVWGKVIFSQASVILFMGGACMPRGHAWGGGPKGARMAGGVHGQGWGCVHGRGAYTARGRSVCVVGWQGGIHGWRGHAWERRPLQRAVRILLECILVKQYFQFLLSHIGQSFVKV